MNDKKSTTIMLAIIAAVAAVAALKIAKAILIPLVISIFLSLALMPLLKWLQSKKIPLGLSSVLALVMVIAGMALLLLTLTASLASLQGKLPAYVSKATAVTTGALAWLEGLGVELDTSAVISQISPGAIGKYVGKSMLSMVTIISNLMMIFFITLFILLESKRFSEKSTKAWGTTSRIPESFTTVGNQVQRYLMWKTVISLATGILVWVFLSIVGLDFALLWGLVAFLLNFVPSIGSIIATVPPILIALVQFENPLGHAAIVLLGLLAIQVTIGNVIDPKLVGRELNISPLVVFLSMIFWGWTWGIVGMLLAVPMMVVIKVIIMHNERLRPIGIMLEG